MADLKIPLHDLDSRGKDYAFPLRHAWLNQVLTDCGVRAAAERPEGRADIRVQRNGREVLLQGHICAHLVAECARCLGDAHFDVESDLATLMTPHEDSPDVDLDDLEIDPEEPDRDYYSGDTLELDGLVREYLVLDLPVDPLCDEACTGIEIPEHLKAPAELGPTDSEGRALDPRLAPLMKLASRERDKE